MRGSGQLFGRRQSGTPDLKLTDLRRDSAVIARTQNLARSTVTADPTLTGHPLWLTEMRRRFEGLEVFAALETG
jgi:RecG-like helicase